MTVPLRFDDLAPIAQSTIRANIAKMAAQGASLSDVDTYLGHELGDPATTAASLKANPNLTPDQKALHLGILARNAAGQAADAAPEPGLLSRVATNLKNVVAHPIDAVEGAATAVPKAAVTALSPGVGEARPDLRLSKGGNASGRPIDTTPYDAEHGGVSGTQRGQAVTQLAATAVAPELGLVGGGALAGAAFSPDDPVAGAVTGGALGAAGKVAGGAAKVAGNVGGRLLSATNLRPENPITIPGTSTSVPLNSISDEAKAIVLKKLGESNLTPQSARAKLDASGKPMTLADLSTPTQRLSRTINTASPVASQQLTDAFGPRQSDAVERVLGDLMDHTNQSGQPSAHLTDQQLVAQRATDATNAYGAAFEDARPIDDPAIQKILNTPDGKRAFGDAKALLGNDRIEVPSATSTATTQVMPPTPPGFSDAQWATAVSKLRAQGQDVPGGSVTTTTSRPTPTIQQLHYTKLALDDLAARHGLSDGAGSGGLGYNRALSIVRLKNDLLDAMAGHNPDYDAARAQYADQSDLLDALRQGGQHFSQSPEQSADVMKTLNPAQQELYVRGAVGQLRQKLESTSPSRDVTTKVGANAPTVSQQQLKLLFPTDQAFQAWQAKLGHEAAMANTNRTTFGGSNTADKVADLAELSGITPRAMVSAASGNPKTLMFSLARNAVKERSLGYSRSLSEAIAPYLTAGADATSGGRSAVIQALIDHQTKNPKPLPGPSRAGAIPGLLTAGNQATPP